MALDKLVDGAQLDSDLGDIANAIRTKGGTSAQLAFPQGFVDAVDAIPTGITPTGTINITSNGTYDVTDKATANVNVPGVTPTGTKQISITANGTTTEDVANYANAEITVNVPSSAGYAAEDFMYMNKPTGEFYSEITTFPMEAAMKGRTGITSVNLPNCITGRYAAFQNCTGIKSVTMPVATTIQGLFLHSCNKLKKLVLPSCYQIGSASYAQVFRSCTSFEALDLGGTPASGGGILGADNFNGDTKFGVLILRSQTVLPLGNISSFTNTKFASGKAGGILYVPQALIAGYQAAANWSTILGYANNQILPIEGSIYETQYVDGTPIPTT